MRVTIDIELTDRTRRTIRWLLLPAALLIGSYSIAHATLDPSPDDWIKTGNPVSASNLTANLKSLDKRLDDIAQRSVLRYKLVTRQDIPDHTAVGVAYDTSDVSSGTAGEVLKGATGEWIFKAKTAGKYMIHAQVGCTKGAIHSLVILKNGGAGSPLAAAGNQGMPDVSVTTSVTTIAPLAAGDQVSVALWSNVAEPLTDSNINYVLVEGPL